MLYKQNLRAFLLFVPLFVWGYLADRPKCNPFACDVVLE
jgi:hypothetical protein